MDKRIKTLASYYVNRYNTNDPYKIAKQLGIMVFSQPLGNVSGKYNYLEHTKCIFINSDIEDDDFARIVMAHELGHALLHWKVNCCFLKNKTLFSVSKLEIEANKFAAELLIRDCDVIEYQGYSHAQIASALRVDEYLLNLKNE